jgi:ADP-ribosyl-[dinitrogen reductase] hydrolase
LKNKYSYEKGITDMLLEGGDTDTNACIVGGLLGAAHGVKSIKEKWVSNVLKCESGRPKFLVPKYGFEKIV